MVSKKQTDKTITLRLSEAAEDTSGKAISAAGVLEFVKAMLWPGIVLVGFYFFASPLAKILHTVPPMLESAQTIDYGGFKISLGRKNLPQPTPEVAAAIAKLDQDSLALLLNADENSFHCDVNTDKYPNANDKNSVEVLVTLGLAERFSGKEDGFCESFGYIKLNILAGNVKQFFVHLITAQFEKR